MNLDNVGEVPNNTTMQDSTDNAVAKGGEEVRNVPEGNDANLEINSQLRKVCLQATEKHKKETGTVNMENIDTSTKKVTKKWV